jgi:hypothetical protein
MELASFDYEDANNHTENRVIQETVNDSNQRHLKQNVNPKLFDKASRFVESGFVHPTHFYMVVSCFHPFSTMMVARCYPFKERSISVTQSSVIYKM